MLFVLLQDLTPVHVVLLQDLTPVHDQVVRLVARLGGFLALTGDGEPGVKTIWLGMQRILDFAAGVKFSRKLQAEASCV